MTNGKGRGHGLRLELPVGAIPNAPLVQPAAIGHGHSIGPNRDFKARIQGQLLGYLVAQQHQVLAKDGLLKKLIADHEPPYAEQWRGLGEEFAHKMLAGIVAFELKVTEVQCKIKLNQHRPEALATMKAIYAAGNENEQALARWMDRPVENVGQNKLQEI